MNVLGRGALADSAAAACATASVGGTSVNAPFKAGIGISAGGALLNTSFLDAASDNTTGLFEATTNYLLAKVILASGVKCEGKNPVEVAKLQLNGQDRFTEREGR